MNKYFSHFSCVADPDSPIPYALHGSRNRIRNESKSWIWIKNKKIFHFCSFNVLYLTMFLHPDPFQKLAWIRICSKLFWSRIIIFDWCENRSRKSSDTDPLTYLLARITRGRCSSYSITPLILYNKKQNLGYVVSACYKKPLWQTLFFEF